VTARQGKHLACFRHDLLFSHVLRNGAELLQRGFQIVHDLDCQHVRLGQVSRVAGLDGPVSGPELVVNLLSGFFLGFQQDSLSLTGRCMDYSPTARVGQTTHRASTARFDHNMNAKPS